MAVLEMAPKAITDGVVDLFRDGLRVLAHAAMETPVTEPTGVPHDERDPESH